MRRSWVVGTTPWVVGLFVLASMLVICAYCCQINPDGLSYLGIAEKYLAGNFDEAVNGYWGPMISWWLVPLLAMGLPPLVAGKVFSLLVGVGVLICGGRLLLRFDLAPRVRLVAHLAMVPALLYFSYIDLAADVLLSLMLLLYLVLVTREDFYRHWWYAVLCGLLGSAAFLTKQFGLFFFGAHFAMISFIRVVRMPSRRGIVVSYFLVAMAVLCLVSAAWGVLLARKYGYFTLGTTGRYNCTVQAPGSEGHYHRVKGLVELPNATADSAWEDPSYFEVKRPTACSLEARLMRQAGTVWKNLRRLVTVFTVLTPLWLCFLAVPVISLMGVRSWWPPDVLVTLLLALAVYCGGYVLVLVDLRFFSFAVVPLWVFGALCLNALWRMPDITNLRRNVLVLIFLVSGLVFPFSKLASNASYGRGFYKKARVIAGAQSAMPGRWASNLNWAESLYITYFLDGQYLGKARANATPEELQATMQDFDIDYVLIWEGRPDQEKLFRESFPVVGEFEGGVVFQRMRQAANGEGISSE